LLFVSNQSSDAWPRQSTVSPSLENARHPSDRRHSNNARIPPSAAPNSVIGIVEQVVYRGFVSHTYPRLANGEPLIVFQSNGAVPPGPGERALARWEAASNRVVHDEAAD
jgi:hypothetical protein